MAKDDVFEKPYVDERDKNNLEGLLEQFNLPPAVITFVRENKRLVQLIIAGVVALVVAWALYDSYAENRIEKAASALAQAETSSGSEMTDKLAAVAEEYKGTDAALWADIIRAHRLAGDARYDEARKLYNSARDRIDEGSPVYALLTYGIGQSSEMIEDYQQASAAYQTLKTTDGFIQVGYLGLGRIAELQKNVEAAIRIYEEYLTVADANSSGIEKRLIEEKVASLKASL